MHLPERTYIASRDRTKAQTQLEEIVQIRGKLLGPGCPEVIAAGDLVERCEECLESDLMDYEDSIQVRVSNHGLIGMGLMTK